MTSFSQRKWRSSSSSPLLLLSILLFTLLILIVTFISPTFSQQTTPLTNNTSNTNILTTDNNKDSRTDSVIIVGGASEKLTRSDLPPFHLIISGSLLGIVVLSGLFISRFADSPQSAKSSVYYFLFKRRIFSMTRSALLNDLLSFTVGELLLLLIYFGCMTSWFFYGLIYGKRPKPMLNKSAVAFGYVAIFNFSLILLPVSRHSVWTWIFNISYERAMKFHRLLGFCNLVMLTVHTILFSVVFYKRNKFAQLFVWNPNLFLKVNILAGIIAWFAMIVLTLFSLPIIRRQLWNTFQVCHVVLAIVVMVFGHLHLPYKLMIPYTAASIVLYGSDVLIRYLSFLSNWSALSWLSCLKLSFSPTSSSSRGLGYHHFVSVRKCEIKAHEHIGVTTAILTCDRSLLFSLASSSSSSSSSSNERRYDDIDGDDDRIERNAGDRASSSSSLVVNEQSHLLSPSASSSSSSQSEQQKKNQRRKRRQETEQEKLERMEQYAKRLCLGKFINLWVWEISAWESHPFSITDVSMPDMGTIVLRLDIKETGGANQAWTGQLNWLASDTDKYVSVTARFDGPFGALTVPVNQPKAIAQYDAVLLFAGGIGVTAVHSITKFCAKYNANTHLTWVVRSPAYLNLFPRLVTMKEHVTTYVTRGGDPYRTDYVQGRPSWDKIVQRQTILPDGSRCKNVAVVVCGPGSMVIDVLNACRDTELTFGTRFHIHMESFEM